MSDQSWNVEKVRQLYEMPFITLVIEAQLTHRQHFDSNEIELARILSIKTGACPEDCSYCSQSGHYQTGIKRERLMPIEALIADAKSAKSNGVTRYCMGAAWRSPPKKDLPTVIEMIKAVKNIGLETCVTLGMLNQEEACELKAAGLEFYNHNLDTSPNHYKNIVTTHTYEDRLTTLTHVRNAGIQVCCGGILSLGETREDRMELLVQLANLSEPPESIPINNLMAFKGTPLENNEKIDNFEFIRTIATARIMMPTSVIRLSAGRIAMAEEMQALCFMAGANSMWLGDKLLTGQNPNGNKDEAMLNKLGMRAKINTQQQLQ
jgi:biotin synthase